MRKQILLIFSTLTVVVFLFSCAKHESFVDPGEYVDLNPDPTVNVLFPPEGENLIPGKTYTIQWDSPEYVKKIAISLYRKGVLQTDIRLSLDNSNKFEWTVPENIFQSVHYKLKITDVDRPDWNYGWSGNFYVKPGWVE